MKEAPLVEHLEELRSRLLWSILAWAVATGVAWSFRIQLLDWLKRPLDLAARQNGIQVNLIVLDITEPFLVSLKVAAFGGLVLVLPFIVYQIWAFIAPGLYSHERRLAVPFLLGAGFSFAVGVVFAYYVFLPYAVPFLLSFLGDLVKPNISLGQYMSQILAFLGVMGIVFEMPVVSYLVARLGLLSSRFLMQNWRVAIVLLITLAAVITPTVDVFNLALISVPLLILYAISILTARLGERGHLRAAQQTTG